MAASFNNTASIGVSSPSDSLVITSPALSASSFSSSGFDFVAVGQRPSNPEQLDSAATISATTPVRRRHVTQSGEDSSFSDDDEIVWGLSESEDLEGSIGGLGDVLSDDDFVVLSRTRSPVSSSRGRIGTSESGSQTGTLKGAPLHLGLLEPRPSVDHPRGIGGNVDASRARNDKDIVALELAEELAKLNVDAESLVGEASGTRTPVEGKLCKPEPNISGALPKKKGKKAKKDRNPEEDELRKQRKKERKEKREREKQEKAAAKALAKGKEKAAVTKAANVEGKKSKQSSESVVAAPVATSMPIAPDLSKNVSTATLVPSSNTTTSRITPESVALPEEATPVPLLAPLPFLPLEPVKTLTSADESPKKKKKKAKKVKATELTTPTRHNTVIAEKVSEQTHDGKSAPTPYDEAVNYITSYISTASARHDPVCHLTLLQSLIIELGLIKDISLLPRSIKAAKKFIKPRVFLNIREYITKRQEGPKVVQSLMFPTRSALVKDMRKRRNFASLQWIKKRGLQDLLVGVFHR